MGKVTLTIVIIFFIIILLYGSFVAYTVGKQHRFLDIPPAPPVPSATPNAIGKQIPIPTTLEGKIIGISLHPIVYKNSTVVTVLKQDNSTIQIYVNTQTTIADINNQKLDLPQLTTGMNISIQGLPRGTGMEASKVTVLNTVR